MTKVILCGKKQGCCPTVEYIVDEDKVIITDDDGDVVTLTYEQYQKLKKTEL